MCRVRGVPILASHRKETAPSTTPSSTYTLLSWPVSRQQDAIRCPGYINLNWLYTDHIHTTCPQSGGCSTYSGLYRDCEVRCCFSAFLLSTKTSNSKNNLTALERSQAVVVPVIFISGRSLCISLPLRVTLLIFSHPACPSSSVSSWRFDSVTAVETRPQSCGGMSAGVRCLSWRRWLLRVWVCVYACVNLMPVCGSCRWSCVLRIEYQMRQDVIHFFPVYILPVTLADYYNWGKNNLPRQIFVLKHLLNTVCSVSVVMRQHLSSLTVLARRDYVLKSSTCILLQFRYMDILSCPLYLM